MPALGEKLVDPHKEGNFLDPTVTAGSDKSLFAVGTLFLSFAVDSIWVVVEANMVALTHPVAIKSSNASCSSLNQMV